MLSRNARVQYVQKILRELSRGDAGRAGQPWNHHRWLGRGWIAQKVLPGFSTVRRLL